jgi:acetyltransferase-like isoleucine patch superfamily enzyme
MSRKKEYTQFGLCKIDRSADIKKGAIIGKPFRRLLDGTQERTKKTILHGKVYIGFYSIVGTGTEIGSHSIINDFSVVESGVKIGKRTLLIYRAQVCNDARVGDDCVIGGLIGERTTIGNRCRIFGNIVHSQENPSLPWDGDESEEKAPTIKDFAFVGFGAVIAGEITLGYKAYILAGAIITKHVPDFHIAWGVNEVVHFSKWKGRKLSQSHFFSAK